MAIMDELILRYREEGWSAKERATLSRSTILMVLQPDCFDDRYKQNPAFVQDIFHEAKKVRHLYPWFIAPTEPAWDRLERDADEDQGDDKGARLSRMLLELDHVDPEYMREVQQIGSFMLPIHARWTKERLGADFRLVANMMAEGRDPAVQLLPRWVIDCMIIRYLRGKTPMQILKLAESAKAASEDKMRSPLLRVTEIEAASSLQLMRKAMAQGDRPAARMSRIANSYADLGEVDSAVAIFDATLKGTEGASPVRIDIALAKASMMQRHGLDGISVIEDLIVKAKGQQRPDDLAACIAVYAILLQQAGRGAEAKDWLEKMREAVYAARDDIRVWHHYPDYLAACRALGRRDLAINILDIGTSSRADRNAMRPLWAEMGIERQNLVRRLWQDANKNAPHKEKQHRPANAHHHTQRHAPRGHAPPHRRR
jgi:tetratricopeptide (TPR) repeat protein